MTLMQTKGAPDHILQVFSNIVSIEFRIISTNVIYELRSPLWAGVYIGSGF